MINHLIKVIKGLRYKGLEAVIKKLLVSTVQINTPKLTALLLAKTSVSINNNVTTGYKALVLRRSIFIDDIRAMADYSGKIHYQYTLRGYWGALHRSFIPRHARASLSENNYYTDERWIEPSKKYRQYLEKMWPYLQRYIGFDVILSSNFGYLSQQELTAVSVNHHVPFIVLYKEGMAVPEGLDDYMKQYATRRFTGTAMLVYNEPIRSALLRASIPGVADTNTHVVGLPRLDTYVKKHVGRSPKRITFFAFFIEDKFRYLADNKELLTKLEAHAKEFYKSFLAFAKQHPEIDFYVTTKLAQHYMAYVKEKFDGEDVGALPNITLTSKVNVQEAVLNSSMIIGFNSITLIEAILAKTMIVTPYFGDMLNEKSWDYFTQFPQLVSYMQSERDFEDAYKKSKNNKEIYPQDARETFLTPFIYKADGLSSSRAEEKIIEYIQQHERDKN